MLAAISPDPSQEFPFIPRAYVPALVAGCIVVLGLFVYGWPDLIRTHWRRVWAISGVCQTESLRRGVLWVTPLAIVGVVVVSQFQHAANPQDSVRQIIKFCLFTSALLVTITAIILACTNLPREIENRVIYTIVTKPTTRLEIILGKVLGFARVSGLILIIMGAFTLAYLELKTRPMIAELQSQIASLNPESPMLATDKYYVSSGLLGTRSLEWADNMQIYSRPPQEGGERWMGGALSEYFLIPFDLKPTEKDFLLAAADQEIPVVIKVDLDIQQTKPTAQQRKQAQEMNLDASHKAKRRETLGPPSAATTAPAATDEPAVLIPQVAVRFLDESYRVLVPMNDKETGLLVTLSQTEPGKPYTGTVRVDAEVLRQAAAAGRFVAQVSARTPATEFGVTGRPLSLVFANLDQKAVPPIQTANDPLNPSQPAPAIFSTYPARHGLRLMPAETATGGPVAVFGFHNIQVSPGPDGKVGLQISPTIEKTGEFNGDNSANLYSTGSVEVRNRKTGQTSGPIVFSPETSRTQPVSVDARYMEGGDFDVLLRNTTPSQHLGVTGGVNGTLAVVSADRRFVVNLVKSLFVLWLLSILVVIVAVFCSTFLSWPIAVVLTLVILLSHWGVDQLGDALKPGACAAWRAVLRYAIPTPMPHSPAAWIAFRPCCDSSPLSCRTWANSR